MKILSEKEAEDFLEKQGFNVVKRKFIRRQAELGRIKLKFPWVMKISSARAVHKTKIGGTILNIRSLKQAGAAFDRLKKIKNINGILVQEMQDGQELILGLKATPEFGIAVMAGAGGVDVEKIKDVSFRMCPIEKRDAKEMLNEIKIKIKRPELVVSNLMGLSKLAGKHPEIQEFDINPLITRKSRAVVVDARAVLK